MRNIRLDLPSASLDGVVSDPPDRVGTVVFAHGSGSSHASPRNQAVAASLTAAGLATVLFDLLTPAESRDRANVFDIPLLASRLSDAVSWVLERREGEAIGLFGASTGGAAALVAAADLGETIGAIVVRGGRPDLAAARLREVRSPTLLIVGGADTWVLQANRQSAALMTCRNEVAVIPGAGHLFEGPGELDEVASRARDWFLEGFARSRLRASL